MYLIAGVDGTGDWDEAKYGRNFKDSHVRWLTGKAQAPNTGFYLRGPSIDGITTAWKGEQLASDILKAVALAKTRSKQPVIFLTGYSLGGAAVVHTAALLAQHKVVVNAMFLFDAVDRAALVIDSDLIPENVSVVYHAQRAPEARSRDSFGSTGTRISRQGKTRYISKKFFCTHGGVGGVPWAEAGDDGQYINESDKDVSLALGLVGGANPLALALRHAYKYSGRTR